MKLDRRIKETLYAIYELVEDIPNYEEPKEEAMGNGTKHLMDKLGDKLMFFSYEYGIAKVVTNGGTFYGKTLMLALLEAVKFQDKNFK